ncbi:MAG: ABC transporter [gamma proteobacterium symbiont of Ctena orbiculata]|uniref:ABC transporter ATP-binding protein n=1 Tax=Candidatus Thiodiazotropha taylori TaxID=2792791 RepID=A0A944QS52_9GAMM|nr:ABC transporter ATP-binding protein [Candidatus Thiodiazotropha taylori]PUB84468.1 MAG: ABC transporter [gamma proteobacterium symbiont of Ctena orbiculata]MBT2988488.1 ABC transporter ATP-binding protein [Candidatus Thiodiazotropha taylori]MBT2997394.1 ABC transporter ATP-binding protein [Candidatus Thiodiazotropha taylori]MBT3000896.1 ABC transporter ATP-binding protein [Candidatus Thiodiazotropha taylori]
MTALIIENLHKTYRNGFEALKGIDLKVEQGDFFALLGPNGAGKSTAISIIASLINKTTGRVEIYGHDLDRERDLAKRLIGLVPQEFNFNMWEPVEEILVNQAGYYGIPRKLAFQRAGEALKRLGLWEKRHTQARWLSGGMKRRLMIARALVHRPRLLILDEPTAGVDIEIRRSMWDFMREINRQGTTIILTTHYLEEAESLCRNIAIIDHGRIVEQTSMTRLLSQLHTEVFLLNMAAPINRAPDLHDYRTTLVDSDTLEVEVDREQSMNQLFRLLSAQGIEIVSMRNKQNRLEQMFVDLVDGSKEKHA